MMTNDEPAALKDLYDRPGFLFRRAHQIFAALFVDICRSLDLTQSQYGVLRLLKHLTVTDQSSLALMLGHDRSTVGLVIANLADRGLLTRQPDPDDRRRNLLCLTPAGHAMVEAATPLAAQAHERIFEPLAPEERLALMESLRKLTAYFSNDIRVPIDPP